MFALEIQSNLCLSVYNGQASVNIYNPTINVQPPRVADVHRFDCKPL